jgi:hypothetical protein
VAIEVYFNGKSVKAEGGKRKAANELLFVEALWTHWCPL